MSEANISRSCAPPCSTTGTRGSPRTGNSNDRSRSATASMTATSPSVATWTTPSTGRYVRSHTNSVSSARRPAARTSAASSSSASDFVTTRGVCTVEVSGTPAGARPQPRASTAAGRSWYPGAMADLEAFRAELRSWLAENVTDDLRGENAALLPEAERVQRLRAWQRKLAGARWVGITWPREYGGREASIPEQIA